MVVQRNADFGFELATTSVIKNLSMLLPDHAELQIVAAHPSNHHELKRPTAAILASSLQA
jgi:hypothetical protein